MILLEKLRREIVTLDRKVRSATSNGFYNQKAADLRDLLELTISRIQELEAQ